MIQNCVNMDKVIFRCQGCYTTFDSSKEPDAKDILKSNYCPVCGAAHQFFLMCQNVSVITK